MPRRAPSVRPPPNDSRPKNRLLASLPPADYKRLRPHLRTIPATAKQVFHPVDEPVRDVFFQRQRRIGDDGDEGSRACARHHSSRFETVNVVVGTDGAVKVLDFGLAKLGGSDSAEEAALTHMPDVALSVTGDDC